MLKDFSRESEEDTGIKGIFLNRKIYIFVSCFQFVVCCWIINICEVKNATKLSKEK